MSRKALILLLMYAFSLLLSVLLVFPLSSKWVSKGQNNIAQSDSVRVLNRNTGQNYSTIQEAINAPETLEGHEIFVASGTYYEHVTVNKSLSLVGQDRSATIIDGNGTGKVVYVTADNVKVSNFTLQNGTFGLWLDRCQNSKIVGNALRDGSYGIRVYHCKNSEVIGNSVVGYRFFGIEVDSSGNSTLRNNSMRDNEYNFGVEGNSLSDFINNIDVSNTVNGKPVRYLMNQHDVKIDSSTFQEIGYLGLVNSTNITVQNLDMQNNIQGILLAFTTNSIISNVNARNNWDGISVAHSPNATVRENNANNNFDYGIKFFNSSRSLASRNNVDENGWAGIGLFRSHGSTIDGNEANFNTYNLHIVYTNNSKITRNNAQSKPGDYSIAVYYSHNNTIYHNTLAYSLLYIETRNKTRFIPRNSWDNGLEGNYWSFYRGVDTNQDGIGDNPYVVGENNVDNYPLMGKFTDFTVTLGEKTFSVTIISNSTISQFQFSPDYREVNFLATGENGTMGFARVAIPNALLQDLSDDNITILINGEHPFLKRKWSDNTYTYWYFSYTNIVPDFGISSWLTVAVASVALIASLLVFLALKKKIGGFIKAKNKRRAKP